MEEDMDRKTRQVIGSFAGVGLLLLASAHSARQEKPAPEEYQAQAMGQGTQLGRTFNVTIHIEEYSTPEERQVLVDAFTKSGSQGLFNALNKMKAKGRVAITGTLGYDISFARKLPTADGVKIRVLTNRPITFGEAWTDSRSMDYNLSAFELDLSNEKGKGTGILLPACQFNVNKKTNEIEIDNFQNPWKLLNVLDRSKK
jgi:hypothetical protein